MHACLQENENNFQTSWGCQMQGIGATRYWGMSINQGCSRLKLLVESDSLSVDDHLTDIWRIFPHSDRVAATLQYLVDLHLNAKKNWRCRSTFGRWGRQKVYRTVVARARLQPKIEVAWFVWFVASILLCRFAIGCEKKQWHGCVMLRAAQHAWCATLLASGTAAWVC